MNAQYFNLKEDPGESRGKFYALSEIAAPLGKMTDMAREDLGDSLTKAIGKNIRPALDIKPKLPDGVKTVRNIEYANPGGIRSLLLDLYLPTKDSDKSLPVVMWIHGGGWTKGSKENCPLIWLADEGYAVASISYRLVPEAKWPMPLEDSRAAIRWLRSNAAKHKLDPKHIIVAGGSAGGNLASITAVSDLPRDEAVSSRVQVVIDFYGASDVLTMPPNVPGPDKTDADLAKTNAARLIGGIVRDHPDLAKQMSPLYHITKDDPPFLIIHGDQDKQVPLEQSERLRAKLKEAGVPAALHVIKGAGHGGKEFDTAEVRKLIREFLQSVSRR